MSEEQGEESLGHNGYVQYVIRYDLLAKRDQVYYVLWFIQLYHDNHTYNEH